MIASIKGFLDYTEFQDIKTDNFLNLGGVNELHSEIKCFVCKERRLYLMPKIHKKSIRRFDLHKSMYAPPHINEPFIFYAHF